MKKLILILLPLLSAQQAWGSLLFTGAPQFVGASFVSQVPSEDEEDESETQESPSDVEVQKKPDSSVAAPPVVSKAPEATSSERQKLVSGAPLFNPNVAVHIVQKKDSSDVKKAELVLYPALAQVNGKFTQHYGTAATAIYHLHENFALQVSGQYNWIAVESALNEELVEKARQEAQIASSLLMAWGAQAGVEVTPIYGKFAWYENHLFNFQIVINGGAGIASTRHQVKPANSTPPTYGDTGTKFLGSLGAGVRLQFKERFAFRLEFRDLVYTARVDTVNGCDATDLSALKAKSTAGASLQSASVSGSCRVATFDGTDSTTGRKRSDDIPLAENLVNNPSSDVLNNVGVYAGFAFLF